MTTTTLSSNSRFKIFLGGLLRKNIPAAIYLFVVMFIFFPLQMVLETQSELALMAEDGHIYASIVTASRMYTSVSIVCVTGILLAASVIIGLVQCSYLHSKRAVDLYHSIPLTRVQLMLANALAAFCTITVPFLFNYAINYGVSLYRVSRVGALDSYGLPPLEIFWDIFGWLVTIFSILAVVNFVATQVGSVFENFVFSCELLVAPLVILLLNEVMFSNFLTGYIEHMNVNLICSTTPVAFMAGRLSESGGGMGFFNWIILLWLVLGAALFWVSLLLYRRRKSEIAETSGCKGIVGIICTAIAVYVCAPAFGAVIFSTWGSDNNLLYVFGVATGAVLTFVLLEAILNRGFSGLRRRLPLGGVVCTLVTIVAVILVNGGLGYEMRVPAANKVTSVELDYRGWYEYVQELEVAADKSPTDRKNTWYPVKDSVTLTNPTSIELVRKVHEQLIAINIDGYTVDSGDVYSSYAIDYQLPAGRLSRRYNLGSASLNAVLQQLESTPEFQQQANPVLRVNRARIQSVNLHDDLGFLSSSITTPGEIDALLDALSKDMIALGSAPFIGGEKVLCYLFIQTPWVSPYSGSYDIGAAAIKGYVPAENHFNSFSVPVFASYSSTLQQLGSNLPKPGDISAVTQLGAASYFKDYGNGDRFVSQVLDTRETGGYYMDYVTSDKEAIAYAAEHRMSTGYTDGYSTGRDPRPRLYCVFFKGKETGASIMLDAENLPDAFLDAYPELRYSLDEQREQSRQARSYGTVTVAEAQAVELANVPN